MVILTSESKTTLTIKRDAIVKLIAEDLGVSIDKIKVTFVVENVNANEIQKSSGYNELTKIIIELL